MNPMCSFKDLLLSKREKREKEEKGKEDSNRIIQSPLLVYSNAYLNENETNLTKDIRVLINRNTTNTSNTSNFYLCCYTFGNSEKPLLKYLLIKDKDINEDFLSFPKIKVKTDFKKDLNAETFILRIKTQAEILFGFDSLNYKGFLSSNSNDIHSNDIHLFFEYFESKQNKQNNNLLWASLHEICNLQKMNVFKNEDFHEYSISQKTSEFFLQHPFLIFSPQ